MAKKPSSRKETKSKSKARATPLLSASTLPTVGALTAAQSAAREQYNHPKTTKDSYGGHLRRGFKFLADLVKERRDKEIIDEMDTDILEKAFSNPPNRYSLFALEAYLTHRCFNEGLGDSTAGCIQGAFAQHWDNMGDGRWSGDSYQCEEKTGTVQGNPARATSFKAIIKSVQNRKKADGSPRNHAEPLDLDAMIRSLRWSENQYPSEALETAPRTESEKVKALKHASTRAIFTFGFNVWTRNFELTATRVRHITRHAVDKNNNPYVGIFVDRRKGWLNKAIENGPLQSKQYKIFKQDIPEIDLYTHLLRYMDYLELIIGRPLAPDEFLFPYISSNGTVHLNREMSHDIVQNLIDEFTGGSPKRYTTHCFRRGGAQYRFMYAPLGQRWSLSAVRWWGGWAEGESVDMLVKYLLDALQKEELDYSDQLCPSRLREADKNKSFMGEHALVAPATVHDLHMLGSTLLTAVRNPQTGSFPASPSSSASAPFSCHPTAGTVSPPSSGALGCHGFYHHNASGGAFPIAFSPSPFTFSHALFDRAPGASSYGSNPVAFNRPDSVLVNPSPFVFPSRTIPSPTCSYSFCPPISGSVPSPMPVNTAPSSTWCNMGYERSASSISGVLQVATCRGHNTATSPSSGVRSVFQRSYRGISSPQQSQQTVSVASIPDLGHKKKGWRRAIAQWEKVDPQTGIPLMEWPDTWFKGAMKTKFAMKRRSRRVVWEERKRLGGTDKKFLEIYPEADKIPFSALVRKINTKNGFRSRVSKNGTPCARLRRLS